MYGNGKNEGSSRFTFKMSKNVVSPEKVKPVNEVTDGNIIKVEERKNKGMSLMHTKHFYSASNSDNKIIINKIYKNKILHLSFLS